jgi:hypothetical protein
MNLSFEKWKTTSIFGKMKDDFNFGKIEDDLNFWQNGRQPQFNGKMEYTSISI